MKLKIIGVMTGTLLLAACSSHNDGSMNSAGAAIPGSIEDFNRNVSNKAFFAFDKSSLDQTAQNNMKSVVEWTKKYPQKSLTVEGHTDSHGTADYNLALGQRRADSAMRFLKSSQVGAQEVNAVSFGKSKLPAGTDNSEATHAQNRVAQVVIQQ